MLLTLLLEFCNIPLVNSPHLRVETLARIKSALQRLDITYEDVAIEATKTSRRGSVGKTAVSHTLAGRYRSANIIATAKRLIAQRRASNGKVTVA